MRPYLFGTIVAAGLVAQSATGETRKFEGWNLSYELPDGLRTLRATSSLHLLGGQTQGTLVAISPAMDSDPKDALIDLQRLLVSLQVAGNLTEEPKVTTFAGMKGMVATGILMDQLGRQYQARLIVIVSSQGTSLRILGASVSDQFVTLSGRLESLAESVKAAAPEVNRQAVAALAGRWVSDTGNYDPSIGGTGLGVGHSREEKIAFDGQGRFEYSYASTVVVPGMPSDIDPTRQTSDSGTYTVIGRSLVLKGSQGTMIVEIEIRGNYLVSGGMTYRRE